MSFDDAMRKGIGAHGLWKAKIRQAIDQGAQGTPWEDVSKDNLCDLG